MKWRIVFERELPVERKRRLTYKRVSDEDGFAFGPCRGFLAPGLPRKQNRLFQGFEFAFVGDDDPGGAAPLHFGW